MYCAFSKVSPDLDELALRQDRAQVKRLFGRWTQEHDWCFSPGPRCDAVRRRTGL